MRPAPEGFQLQDPGYRVAVLEGWTVEDWEHQEATVSESGRFSDYELIGIERADYREFDAADWQFRWQAGGGPLRVLNRNVVDEDVDRAFALYWSVPDEEWDASGPVLDNIAASFQPLD